MRRLTALRVAVLGTLMLASTLFAAQPAAAGYAHFVLDANTGKVLASENADTLNHPASLTKMMTLYMTFEAIRSGRIGWETRIPMTKRAAHVIPLKLGVRAGQSLTVREAVLGMIVLSANDAAETMCDYLAGSGDCGSMLTRKARQLGMTRTTFRNGSGLPDARQVTTARDMARLGVSLIRDYPSEYRLFSTRAFSFRGRGIHGHNRLMYRYHGMDGIKTGYTNASGFNIVTAVNDGGRRVIGVVMGGRTAGARDAKMAALLNATMPTAMARRDAAPAPAPIKQAPQVAVVREPTPEPQREEAKVASLGSVPLPSSRYATTGKPAEQAKASAKQAADEDDGNDEDVAQATAAALASEEPNPDNMSSDPDTLWQVQIATAKSEDDARGILEKARGKAGSSLNGAMNFAQAAGGGVYRARFIGFNSRQTAETACRALKAKSFSCQVISGNG
ncbi:serine hydrolase [Rhizobium sp. C4]|uniref:serine hydrolase n=1 Tax=Rhizobium sp. C4 TaxID=1349800 RepID=UPI001E64BF82|nr:serine hydrolase [Rhizobium sp. C4]MCD2173918.1 D-alanyl-D-alanine carboxypeptidase [Rhizobium sp. C4]